MRTLFHEEAVYEKGREMAKILLLLVFIAMWSLHFTDLARDEDIGRVVRLNLFNEQR